MNSTALIILAAIIGVLFGHVSGWSLAHEEIATECRRQGGFYFLKEDFACSLKEKK